MDIIRLAAIACLLIAAPAWANDSSFGGRGGDPMPIENDAIEMVEEHVVLRADTGKNHWAVTTEFTFRNATDKKVDVQMGFPFVANLDEGDVAVPAGTKYPETGDPLVWDFRTWVNGKEVKVKLEKASPNPKLPDLHYDIVYLRNVTFGPGETVTVKNSYRHGISMSVMMDSWVHYVLRTGGLWRGGKIGRSRLEVHVPPKLRLPDPGHVAYMRDGDGKVMRDKSGEKLVQMKFDIKPQGARIERTSKGTSIFWDLRDFAPKSDLEATFLFAEAAPNYHHVDVTTYTDAALEKMTKEELRFARNTISAQYGYEFKSEDLQSYFAKKWWYTPNPDFNFDTNLTREEQELVRKIKEYEGKAPSKPESDPLQAKAPAAPTRPVEQAEEDAPSTTPAAKPAAKETAPKQKSSGCATTQSRDAGPGALALAALFAARRRRRTRP